MSLNCVSINKGLRIDSAGRAQFCCRSNQFLTTKNGELFKLHKHKIEEALYGTKAQEIRESFNKGEKHTNCSKCWIEEDSGVNSKRLRDINSNPHLLDEKVEPKILEFNLGNMCNLKCRICSPFSSSMWIKEHYDLYWQGDRDTWKGMVNEWKGHWDDSETWLNLEEHLSLYEQIEFYGGEPFLVKRNWDVLQKSIDKGYANNQKLHFNTNGTYCTDEYIDILKEFKFVALSLSIDDIESRFEYQRHPAKWEMVEKNIDKFLNIQKEYPDKFSVVVCVTINNLNVYYLPEITSWVESKLNFSYHVNWLHYPSRFSIIHLPQNLKKIITEKYEKYLEQNISENSKQQLLSVINYMNKHIDIGSNWTKFLLETERTDKYRNENFKTVFPEWNTIIEAL